MLTTASTHDYLGEVTPVEGDLTEAEIQAYTDAILNSEIPEPEQVRAPRYYIDSFTDPFHPVYFENSTSYPIVYNQYTGTYHTLASGVRLIIFAMDQNQVLEKVADLDLRVHHFSYADIFSPDLLTSALQLYQEMSVEEFIQVLGIGELQQYDSAIRNLETVLAQVFGRPAYKDGYQWGWFVAGYNYGIEVYSDGTRTAVRLIDEEHAISRIPQIHSVHDEIVDNIFEQLSMFNLGEEIVLEA